MYLPEEFCLSMKDLLGEEFHCFLAEYDKPALRGIRRNPLKVTEDAFFKSTPFSESQSPFSPLSFYTTEEKLGHHPGHHAGAFYVQEPSASSAVTILDPQPGEKILDLCAAPGGKTTQIASLTEDTGLLIANEIVRSRASVLASNLERMGIRNVVVTSCRPDEICSALPAYFDRILVDAPCSGEGMFRHDPQAVKEWKPTSPSSCAARQAEILDSAAEALRPGGILVYSTCTFSKEENEDTVLAFLSRHPDYEAIPTGVSFGRSVLGGCGLRILPMDGGEGHFVAKLHRKEDPSLPRGVCTKKTEFRPLPKDLQDAAVSLLKECFTEKNPPHFFLPDGSDTIYAVPENIPLLPKIPVVRFGYEFAKICGKRLEPCHGAFLCRKAEECRSVLTLSGKDPLLLAYLRGEEIPCDPSLKGYTAVAADGIPCGYGKATAGRLKNKYPKGLRNHK